MQADISRNTHMMSEAHRKVLVQNRMILAKNLCADEVLQYLVQENIFSDRMVERILAKQTNFDKNVALLTMLPTRGPLAFEAFKQALRTTDQGYLVENIERDEARLIKDRGYERAVYKRIKQACSVKNQKHFILTEKQKDFDPSLQKADYVDVYDSPVKLFIERTSLEFYTQTKHTAYKMTSRPRGLALVISIRSFIGGYFPYREGGEIDQHNLSSLLKQLDYEVTVAENCTSNEIINILEEFARKSEHRTADSCFVAVLSHGCKGRVYGSDRKSVTTESIFKAFDNMHSRHLQNKPKIFLIQACRNDNEESKVKTSQPSVLHKQCRGPMMMSGEIFDEHDDNHDRLPTSSDMIIGFATSSGDSAMRNTQHGSMYIQAFLRVVAIHAKDKDMAEILTLTNAFVRQREKSSRSHKCAPEFHSNLCKKLYFYPGIFSKLDRSETKMDVLKWADSSASDPVIWIPQDGVR